MRIAVFAAALLLSACAGNALERQPPPGVDFTGHWTLNEADSDDPLRLSDAAAQAAANTGNAGAGSGGGGRARRGGSGAPSAGSPAGPPPPSIGAMGAGLSWPGKQLEITQSAGVVTFSSDGRYRLCEPKREMPHRHKPDDEGGLRAAREAPPPTCGWSDKTLVIHTADPDDEHPPFEERYSLSADGQRLIEVVGFKSGRSNGFTMSRAWDKAE